MNKRVQQNHARRRDRDSSSSANQQGVAAPAWADRLRQFWVLAGIIALLGASLMAREIDRPFYGLHSLDQAHNAWLARSHVVYGLEFTHGFPTFAVGAPSADGGRRYLDHPVLYALLDAGAMSLFGVNTWALRVANILATVVALLLFLKIVRALTTDGTALLAGLVFVQLPIITYFGINQWLYPLCFLALWCYLVLIKAAGKLPDPTRFHAVSLSVLLFAIVQIQWQGTFFALALVTHYLCGCLHRKKWPDLKRIVLLGIPPFIGLVVNFVVLAGGGNWDFGRLWELVRWRAGSAEQDTHEWLPWFARLWEFSLSNFTWVVVIIVLSYFTVGQVFLRRDGTRRFPEFWLFVLPAIFQISILKGVVWEHQWWLRPLVPAISIATASGVLLLADQLGRIDRRLARIAVIVLLLSITASTMIGTNHYFRLRYYFPERLQLFERLQERIPPDQALLSFESYLFDQKPGVKQASYRPEVGWHLNREIVVARTLEDIVRQARTGNFPYYLMPVEHPKDEVSRYLGWLGQQLRSRYTSQQVRADPDQWLFDLQADHGEKP